MTKAWKIVAIISSIVLALVGAGTVIFHVYRGVINDVVARFDRKLTDAKRSIELTVTNAVALIKPAKK